MKPLSIIAASTGSALAPALFALVNACSGASGSAREGAPVAAAESGADDAKAAAPSTDAGPGKVLDGSTNSDAGAPGPSPGSLPFHCSNAAAAPSACPAVNGPSGHVSFCYRPQWSGVTSVEVYGGFGAPSDWSAPFVTLTNDGTGTFLGAAALPDGAYPYLFRTHGGDDHLVTEGHYFLDQENPAFAPHPPGAPLQRSVSMVTVPQVAAPQHHVKGSVVFKGSPQGCYSIALEAGELRFDGGAVRSEHTTANYAESAPDGTFDFPVAPGPFGVIVRFPFLLSGADAGYPDPAATPSIGYAGTTLAVSAGDVVVDAIDVSYPAADYAAMTPTTTTTTSLPATFTFSVIPGASAASLAVIGTRIPGNDPLYWGPFGSATTASFDGTFGGKAGRAIAGHPYYWGTWQKSAPKIAGGTVWSEESLLFPITFQ